MKFAIYILCWIACSIAALADATYPYTLAEIQRHEGGRLLAADGGRASYFVKNDFASGGVSVYSWSGIRRSSARGNSFDGALCIASFTAGQRLVMILRESDKFFAALLDTNLATLAIKEIHAGIEPYIPAEAKLCDRRADEFLLLINKKLFLIKISGNAPAISTKSESALAAEFTIDDGFAYIRSGETFYTIIHVDESGRETERGQVNRADIVALSSCGGDLIALTAQGAHANVLGRLYPADSARKAESGWIESPPATIALCGNDCRTFYIARNNGIYELNIKESLLPDAEMLLRRELPAEYVAPVSMSCPRDAAYLLFANAIMTFSTDGEVLSDDRTSIGELFESPPELSQFGEYIIIASDNMSVVLERTPNELWQLNRFISQAGQYIVPGALAIALIILVQLYRHQKRLLRTILELPSLGIIYVIDSFGRLTRTNDEGRRVLGISSGMPLGKQFAWYCSEDNSLKIKELIEKSLENRESIRQKIVLRSEGAEKEYICNLQVIRNIAGNFRGLIFTGADITEQLERKRLSNWAHLAHDMQTNLSTIKLNAELLELGDAENHSRKSRIVHQAGLLIQRVRDIVTVGRSDTVNPGKVNAREICEEVRSEFDPAMFPDVEFRLETESFTLSCDRAKMIRAIRNAVENGIRSLKNKSGIITIKCYKDARRACFAVADTGSGMDEKTRRKFMTPYFTTSQSTGGAGIGTMIMQHVIDLHGGELTVESRKGEGTEITFCIPMVYKK
ncbi:MAG: sensor histidine kinase [Candidatus Kapaibacterium sp.]